MALSQDQAEKFLGLMTEMLGAMNGAGKEESQEQKQVEEQPTQQPEERKAASQEVPQEEHKTENVQEKPKSKVDDSAEKLMSEAQTLLVKAQFVNTAAANGLDNSTVETLHNFISYDKLINDKGEPDKEQINKLVSQLKGIATSQPPKSNNKQQLGSDNGLSKYIQ